MMNRTIRRKPLWVIANTCGPRFVIYFRGGSRRKYNGAPVITAAEQSTITRKALF